MLYTWQVVHDVVDKHAICSVRLIDVGDGVAAASSHTQGAEPNQGTKLHPSIVYRAAGP